MYRGEGQTWKILSKYLSNPVLFPFIIFIKTFSFSYYFFFFLPCK